MPFHTDEEPTRNQGSTDSSLDSAPSPTGPTIWSPGISPFTSSPPDWLPRSPSASHRAGCACASSASTTNTDRSSYPLKSGLVVCTT